MAARTEHEAIDVVNEHGVGFRVHLRITREEADRRLPVCMTMIVPPDNPEAVRRAKVWRELGQVDDGTERGHRLLDESMCRALAAALLKAVDGE